MLSYVVSLEHPIPFARPRDIDVAYRPDIYGATAPNPSIRLVTPVLTGPSAPERPRSAFAAPPAKPAKIQLFAHFSSRKTPRINTSESFENSRISIIPNDFNPTRINTSGAKDLKSIRINTSGNKDLKSFRINTSKNTVWGRVRPHFSTEFAARVPNTVDFGIGVMPLDASVQASLAANNLPLDAGGR